MEKMVIRFNSEDAEKILQLKQKYGIKTNIEVIRLALNYLSSNYNGSAVTANNTGVDNNIIVMMQKQIDKLQDELSKSIASERNLYKILYDTPSTTGRKSTKKKNVSARTDISDTKPVKAADVPKAPVITATVADVPVKPVTEAPVVPAPTPIVQTIPESVVTDNTQSTPKKYDPIEHYSGNPIIEALLADADDGSEW